MRVAFDMDGTLVGQFVVRGQTEFRLNAKLVKVARNLSRQGHRLILWTFGNREWWRTVRAWWPELTHLFREVYTLDDGLHRITRGGGAPERVKDVRLIRADLLVDNDPAHMEWARRHGLADRYVTVRTFGRG